MKFDTSGNGTVFASGLNTPESITIKRTSTTSFIPKLAINKVGTSVVLKWPTAASGFNVYSTTNLAHPNWQLVSGSVFTNGSSLVLTNGISTPTRFFRLSNP